jgi:YHS domain-containing protein
MAVDIVCGTELNEHAAIKKPYGDRPYYFCSKGCEMNFDGNPFHYLDRSPFGSSYRGVPSASRRRRSLWARK